MYKFNTNSTLFSTSKTDVNHFEDKLPKSQQADSWFLPLLINLTTYSVLVVPIALLYCFLKYTAYFDREDNSRLHRFLRLCFLGEKNPYLPVAASKSGVQNVKDDSNDKLDVLLKSLPYWARYLFCLSGLLGSFVVWGILQEKLMVTKYESLVNVGQSDHYRDSQFLVLMNRVFAVSLSAVFVLLNRYTTHVHTAPLFVYSYASFSNVLSSWCQYEALKYITFPTQVLGKACKVIPVMLMGIVVQRKSYPMHEYFTGSLLSIGMSLFMWSRGNSDGKAKQFTDVTTLSGVILMAGYIFCDSFTSNWQDKLFKTHSMTRWEMMCGVCSFSMLITFSSELIQGNLMPTLHFIRSHNGVWIDLLLTSACSAFGQVFIFLTLKHFGAVNFTIMMNVRQAISVVLSCIAFGHILPPLGILGVCIVFFSLMLRPYCGKRYSKSSVRNISVNASTSTSSNNFTRQ